MKELTLEEIQQVEFGILERIAAICDRLHLRYTLMYGTLLGAIRHKGFIPWDDDLDIMMPRKDHDKLMEYLEAHPEEAKGLRVFNAHNDPDYPYMITRISDDRTVINMDNEKPYGMGVFMDIYPFDGLGNDFDEAMKLARKGDHLSSLMFQATRLSYDPGFTKGKLKRALKLPAFLYARMMGKNHFKKKLLKLEGVKDFDSSKYVAAVTWISHYKRDHYLRELFDEMGTVEFNGKQFMSMANPEKILTKTYGDFMKLPPVEERVGHHTYRAYWKEGADHESH